MKKSFKAENPALQFITRQDTRPAEATQPTQPTEPTQPTQDAQPTEPTQRTQPTQGTQPARKRGTGPEIKSARLNLVLRPSLAQALKQIATMRRISVNSLVNDALQALVDTEGDTIAMYNATFERTKENA